MTEPQEHVRFAAERELRYTDLHLAAYAGDHEAVLDYVHGRKGFAKLEINGVDEFGWTPLHHAAKSGHANVLITLLQAGADKNIKNHEGKTPYDLTRSAVVRSILARPGDHTASTPTRNGGEFSGEFISQVYSSQFQQDAERLLTEPPGTPSGSGTGCARCQALEAQVASLTQRLQERDKAVADARQQLEAIRSGQEDQTARLTREHAIATARLEDAVRGAEKRLEDMLVDMQRGREQAESQVEDMDRKLAVAETGRVPEEGPGTGDFGYPSSKPDEYARYGSSRSVRSSGTDSLRKMREVEQGPDDYPPPALPLDEAVTNAILDAPRHDEGRYGSYTSSRFRVSGSELDRRQETRRSGSGSVPRNDKNVLKTSSSGGGGGRLNDKPLAKSTSAVGDGRAGVGLCLVPGQDGTLQITHIVPGGAASESRQISPGDILVTVGGRSVVGLGVAGVAGLIGGAPGTTVELGIRSRGRMGMVRLTRKQTPASRDTGAQNVPTNMRHSTSHYSSQPGNYGSQQGRMYNGPPGSMGMGRR